MGTGARAGRLVEAAASAGWIPVVGQHPNVGMGGLMLGGGMGWLCGAHGAAVDHLLAANAVTANGRLLHANASENSDLFWALRGGGGNFGIVTSLTVQMQRAREVAGGVLSYKVDPAEFLKFYRSFLANSPDELDLGAAFVTGADPTLMLQACWTGDMSRSDAIFRPLRAFAKPTVDTIKPQTYLEFTSTTQLPALNRMIWRGGEFATLSDDVVGALANAIAQGSPGDATIGVGHYMHGELCRANPEATPFVRTQGHICYNATASWNDATGTAEIQRKTAWVKSVGVMLDRVASVGGYVNYLSHDDEHHVRASFGRHYERLRTIKRKYDPENLFRNNQNIRV